MTLQVLKAFRSMPFKQVPAGTRSGGSAPLRAGAQSSAPAAAKAAAAPAPAKAQATSVSPASSSSAVPGVRLTDGGKQLPIGNGGVGPNYVWTQTLGEVTVYISVAEGIASKSIVWEVTSTTVSIGLKGGDVLLEGALGGPVKPSDCLWSLEVRCLQAYFLLHAS